MRLNILSFVFIVFCQISVAQVSVTNNSLQSNNNCPLMEVSISSNNNSGIIEVSYCNHGNAIAIGAYVEIEVTNDLLVTQATIPVSSVVNKKYTFDLGDVNSLDCGAFYIEIPNADQRIHCTSVRIFPDDPCQAMIDQYIINRTEYDDDNDDDDNDDNGNGTNIATVTFSEDLYHSAPGPPLLGQGGSNSVFEDHVFLNNIPSWDSLLSVLTNSGVLPSVTNTSTSGTASTMNGLNDITTLASAELCTNNSGGTVVLTDVLTETRDLDRTVDHSQGSSSGTTTTTETTTATDSYENKEIAVRLYPNPFSTTATITIDGANYQQITLEVLDIAGKSIQSLQVNEQQSITLHRGTLSQGVYFYRLVGDNVAVHTGKFVIR